jgi:hypothetical protein
MQLLRLLLLVPPEGHADLSKQAMFQRVLRKAALATSLVAILGLANANTGGGQALSSNPSTPPTTNQSFVVELEVSGQ